MKASAVSGPLPVVNGYLSVGTHGDSTIESAPASLARQPAFRDGGEKNGKRNRHSQRERQPAVLLR